MKNIFKGGWFFAVAFFALTASGLFIAMPAKASTTINEAHPDGVLIDLGDATHTILLIKDGQGIGIPSPSVFASYGYSFDKVVPANKYDPFFASSVMKYADGTIVNENGTIYIIGDGKKRGFTRPEIFTELGYSFSKSKIVVPEDIYKPTLAQYQAGNPISNSWTHPEGALIQTESGQIYQIKNGRRIGIPSMDVFNSYGFSWSNVVSYTINDLNEYKFDPTNSEETMKFRDGTVVLDTIDNRTVYVISNGKKRGITSQEALEAYGYKWGNVFRGNLSSYSTGNTITLFDSSNTAVVGSVNLASNFLANKNVARGPEDVIVAKFVFTAATSYTIKQITISGNKYDSAGDYLLALYDENTGACVSPDLRILVAGKAVIPNLNIEVTLSNSRTILIKSKAYGTKNIGDRISLSINSASDIITTNGTIAGNFPLQGPIITTVAPAEEGSLDKTLIPVDITGQDLMNAGFNTNEFEEIFEMNKEGVWTYILTSSLSDNLTDWKDGVAMQIVDFSLSKYKSLDEAIKHTPSVLTQEEGVYMDESYTGNVISTGEQYYMILSDNILYAFSFFKERNGAKVISLLDAKFERDW